MAFALRTHYRSLEDTWPVLGFGFLHVDDSILRSTSENLSDKRKLNVTRLAPSLLRDMGTVYLWHSSPSGSSDVGSWVLAPAGKNTATKSLTHVPGTSSQLEVTLTVDKNWCFCQGHVGLYAKVTYDCSTSVWFIFLWTNFVLEDKRWGFKSIREDNGDGKDDSQHSQRSDTPGTWLCFWSSECLEVYSTLQFADEEADTENLTNPRVGSWEVAVTGGIWTQAVRCFLGYYTWRGQVQ